MAGQLEGKVRLDRHAQLDRAAGIVVPAALGHLLLQQIACGLGDPFFTLAGKECHEEDIFRLEDGVAFQFADPVAISLLQAEEASAGAVDGGLERGRVRVVVPETVGRRAQSLRSGGICSVHGIPFLNAPSISLNGTKRGYFTVLPRITARGNLAKAARPAVWYT